MSILKKLQSNFVFECEYKQGELLDTKQSVLPTITGSNFWINMNKGKAVRFVRGGGFHYLTYTNANYNIASGTYIILFRRNSLETGANELMQAGGVNAAALYNLFITGGYVGMNDYAGGTGFMSSGITISDREYHTIAVKFAAGANGVTFYVDGIKGNSDTWVPGTGGSIINVGVGQNGVSSGGIDIAYFAVSNDNTISHEDIASVHNELMSGGYISTLSKTNFVEPVPESEELKYGSEKMVDGDMEAVGTTNWVSQSGATVSKSSTTPHSGTQCLRVLVSSGDNAAQAIQGALIVGKKYKITGWSRTDGIATRASLDGFGTAKTLATTSTWTYFEYTELATSAYVQLGIVYLPANQDSYVEFDDVSVKEEVLVGSWDMQEDGGVWSDLSSGNNNLTKVGQVGITKGLFENCTQFDGASGYLTKTIANYRSADTLGSITALIKLNALGTTQIIFGSTDEAVVNSYFAFYINSANKLSFAHIIAGTNNTVASTNTLRAGEWYKVSLTSNGTAWKMYINGVEETLAVSSGSNTGDWFADITTRDNITIGVLKKNTLLYFFNGQINDVKVYSKELSAAEGLADYNKVAKKTIYRNTFEDAPVSLGTSSVDLNGFTPISGTHKISQDTTKKKWLENVTVGTVFNRNERAYGTFQADLYLTASGQTIAWNFTNTKQDSSGNGYRLTVSGTGGIYLARITAGGSATQGYSALGYIALNTKYQIRVIRSHIGVFSFYVRGGAYSSWTLVSVVGGGGANPFTDNTHTTSLFQNVTTSVANGGKISNIVIKEGVLDPSTYPEIV